MILEYVLFKMLEKLLKDNFRSKTYHFLIYIMYLLKQISKFDEIMLPSRFIDTKLKLFRHIAQCFGQFLAVLASLLLDPKTFHLYNTQAAIVLDTKRSFSLNLTV